MKKTLGKQKEIFIAAPKKNDILKVSEFLEQTMETMEISLKTMNRVQVSVDEIFSNIVHYSGASETAISLEKSGVELRVKFCDNGKPFDPTGAGDPDVTLPAEKRSIGGLGIFMVRRMTSSMRYEYRDGWNMLTLVFEEEQPEGK